MYYNFKNPEMKKKKYSADDWAEYKKEFYAKTARKLKKGYFKNAKDKGKRLEGELNKRWRRHLNG